MTSSTSEQTQSPQAIFNSICSLPLDFLHNLDLLRLALPPPIKLSVSPQTADGSNLCALIKKTTPQIRLRFNLALLTDGASAEPRSSCAGLTNAKRTVTVRGGSPGRCLRRLVRRICPAALTAPPRESTTPLSSDTEPGVWTRPDGRRSAQDARFPPLRQWSSLCLRQPIVSPAGSLRGQ